MPARLMSRRPFRTVINKTCSSRSKRHGRTWLGFGALRRYSEQSKINWFACGAHRKRVLLAWHIGLAIRTFNAFVSCGTFHPSFHISEHLQLLLAGRRASAFRRREPDCALLLLVQLCRRSGYRRCRSCWSRRSCRSRSLHLSCRYCGRGCCCQSCAFGRLRCKRRFSSSLCWCHNAFLRRGGHRHFAEQLRRTLSCGHNAALPCNLRFVIRRGI
mmetsp:Transcript_2723/g.7438  ORF Transcript_2723/g.7438 Transcript_2723/m.7438 type:complete len:215 (+) Transcript_2723:1144-1788(+)